MAWGVPLEPYNTIDAQQAAILRLEAKVEELEHVADKLDEENEELRQGVHDAWDREQAAQCREDQLRGQVARLEAENNRLTIAQAYDRGRAYVAEKDAAYLRHLLETDGGRHA